MATGAITPPPGFELEGQSSSPTGITPPKGFVIEPSQAAPSGNTDQGSASPLGAQADAGSGIVKGLGQTVAGIGGLINKIPGVGETLAPKQGVEALKSMSEPQGMGEKIGSGLEGIAEFVTGDEALQGLSLAKKLGIATKVAKLAEEYPTLGKALNLLMTSGRQGAVGAGQTLAKGGTPEEAATTGAEVAGGSAALGAATEAAGPAINKISKAINPKSVQPEIQQTIKEAVGNPGSKSIAKTVEEAGDKAYAEAKQHYRVLDEATGGRVQRFDDRLKNIKRALDGLTGTEEDIAKEAKLLKAQKETEDAMQEAFNDAEKAGVDPKVRQQASDSFKKSQALYDVDRAVKQSTSGMRPDIGDAKAAAKNPEVTDPEKLFKRINDLHRSGRLQDALGEKGADELLSKTNQGLVKYRGLVRNEGVAKKVGYGAAGLAGAGVIGSMVRDIGK